MKIIDRFYGEHFFLSNFYESPIKATLYGQEYTFATGEHLFHAGKTATSLLPEGQRGAWLSQLEQNSDPQNSKRMGRRIPIDVGRWDAICVQVMRRVQELKYDQNPELAKLLVATGDAMLIEGNVWNDRKWGMVNGKGENLLGKILMELRSELS